MRGVPAFVASLSVCLMSSPVLAQRSVADFYAGKTVTIVVGLPPGGGFDLYARLIGRHLGTHLPGNPSVIVQNMPGAGSLQAGAYVYGVAPQDGTIIGAPSTNLPIQPLVGRTGIRFDPLKFQWLPMPSKSPTVLIVRHRSTARTIEDLRERETSFGAVAAGSPPTVAIALYNEILKTRMRAVIGYSGLPAAMLALERGELDGYPTVPMENLLTTYSQQLQSGDIQPVLQSDEVRAKDLPDVPSVFELVTHADDLALLRLGQDFVSTTVPYMVGPEVPLDRVSALRKAFTEMFADSAFRQDAAQQHMSLNPVSSDAVTQHIRQAYATDRSVVRRFMSLIGESN